MKKRSLMWFMVMVLVFSFSSVVSAAPTSSTTGEGPSIYGPTIVPFDVQLINGVGHTGCSAYEKSFTLSPDNGDNLNVWVKNNHSTKTVYFKVERTDNNQDFRAVAVGSGDQLTRTFFMTGGGGMQGTYKVYVYTTDGHNMDITVSARQH
ncbi:hypothetical protein [Paenibacillus sp. MMS18-CY102]|uniref:hypothetical protein n=1 Tax=Paenibacillus sp. MMS18-CY102 TaxID=2682849 RepID=UPI001365B867|nr:hypothetical protein [Paenibacillus sp. MMS18-CY102]MWC27581.1 hypothetical protein [Paenibacillus sp. MMS18-CY102]